MQQRHQLSASAGHYRKVLPVLTVPIMQIDTMLPEHPYNDNLIYHYMSGIALRTLRRWHQVVECFEIRMCTPVQVQSGAGRRMTRWRE